MGWIGIAVMIGVLFAAAGLMSEPAEARRSGGYSYSQEYRSKKPLRGYEGWVFPGYYCTYKRYPRRVCTQNKSGKERCRISGWTLEQYCY